jgi:hypothetical protein
MTRAQKQVINDWLDMYDREDDHDTEICIELKDWAYDIFAGLIHKKLI